MKSKLPIIAIVLVVVVAGLFLTGTIGGRETGPLKKHVIEPIALAEPFTVNANDTDSSRYVALNVAVQLEPMDEAHWAAFTGAGGGGHGGGSGPGPGVEKVSTYPKFRDAVIATASTFSSKELASAVGQKQLKNELLERFAEIAETDAAEAKSGADADDPGHVGPPYHVQDVYLTKFVVQ